MCSSFITQFVFTDVAGYCKSTLPCNLLACSSGLRRTKFIIYRNSTKNPTICLPVTLGRSIVDNYRAYIALYICPTPRKNVVCAFLDHTESTFFCLRKLLKKIADDQYCSVTKGSIYYNKHNVHTTF